MKLKDIAKKYWEKKYFRVGAISLGVFLLLMITVPYLFKDTLYRKTKNAIGESMNATVNFKSFQLSLFHGFPNLQIRLKELSISGAGEFKNDTMLYAETVATDVSFFKVITGGDIDVHDLIFDKPKIYLLVGKDGKENWDYGKSKAPKKKSKDTFKVRLDNIVIDGGDFIYEDQTSNMLVHLKDLSLKMNGSLYGAITQLKSKASTSGFTFAYGGSKYLEDVPLKVETGVKINFRKMDFYFDNGKIFLKDLPLVAQGGFSMPNDTINMNFDIKAPGSKFEHLLALVPKQYQSTLKGADAVGSADISGFVKGFYTKGSYPAFGMKVGVKDASLQFKGLPEKIQQVMLDLDVEKPQGSLDNTIVKINDMSAVIGGNQVQMNLDLDHMISDLHFKGNFGGEVDFASLKNAMPIDSVEIAGKLDGKVMAEGVMSSIKKKDFTKVKTQGFFNLNKFSLTSAKLPQKLFISNASATLKPNLMTLANLKGNIGKSDFAMNGNVRDFYSYLFGKGTLGGTINLRSSLLDLNQLMPKDKTETEQKSKEQESVKASDDKTAASSSFKVPERINFTFNGQVNRVLYDKFDITGAKGSISIHDKAIDLRNMGFRIFDGQMLMNGRYTSMGKDKPSFALKMSMKDLSLPKTYNGMHFFKNMLPLAEHSSGSFSTSLTFKGFLGQNMEVLMPTVNGLGDFSTKNVKIEGAGVLNQVAAVLKNDKWKSVNLSDFISHFTIENGNLIIKPFKVKISGQEVTVSGKKGVDDRLDMRLDMKLEHIATLGGFGNLFASLPQAQGLQSVDAGVLIGGTVSKPIIKLDIAKAKEQAKQQVKQKVKEEVQKKAESQFQNAAKKIGDELNKIFK
ncbi:MAG: AsmA-like C-terminal region-containing protein [Bacteroidota bacterium]|nr:AsmA-like C-terminal region-containing protein [Bacteroidota bacterium]